MFKLSGCATAAEAKAGGGKIAADVDEGKAKVVLEICHLFETGKNLGFQISNCQSGRQQQRQR